MADMCMEKTPMPEQAGDVRNKNFDEVALGYTVEMAKKEAGRCLNCAAKPCVSGCPVGVRIPEFISEVSKGDFAAAYEIITSTNALPAVCGRVCPQESQCEGRCVRAKKGDSVGIGRLERFVADYCMENGLCSAAKPVEKKSGRVAVIGSGPAGLSCAGSLISSGFSVTVFEAFHTAGGVLVYGIPEFRLPKRIVSAEIDALAAKGVEFRLNSVAGRTFMLDELYEEGFDAVFIATGAGLPRFMGIEGENSVGVYSANEYLTRTNLMKAYMDEYDTPIIKGGRVAVVGGGNVAMDAARCAKRLGAEEVYIIYRRSQTEMPARAEEVHHAKEEGIIFKNLTNPVKINSDENGHVVSIECVEMELGEPDDSGRRSPVEKKGSEFTLQMDTVIMAIGTSPNPIVAETTTGLSVNRRGCIEVDEHMASSKPMAWAGGDAVTGAATVILAMGAGKTAAEDIAEKLNR